MKGKLLFVTGAAVGYVLGARAGRKRYEQIKGAAERIWQTPGVQNQVEQAKEFAAQRVGDVPGALSEGAKWAFSTIAGTRKNPPAPAETSASKAEKTTSSAQPAAKKQTAKPAAKKPAAKKPAAKKSAPKKQATRSSTAAKGSSSTESE